MNENELRELFSDLRDDPVPAESLARVRMAVAERVQARRRAFGIGWRIAAGLAVCGCLAAVMLRPRVAEPVQAPVAPVIAVGQSAPEPALPPRPAVRKRAQAVAQPVRQIKKAPAANVDAGGAAEIRIENPYDPDVVIVLIGG